MSVSPEVQKIIEDRHYWMNRALAAERKFNALKRRACKALSDVEAEAMLHGADNVWLFEKIDQEYNAIHNFTGEENA